MTLAGSQTTGTSHTRRTRAELYLTENVSRAKRGNTQLILTESQATETSHDWDVADRKPNVWNDADPNFIGRKVVSSAGIEISVSAKCASPYSELLFKSGGGAHVSFPASYYPGPTWVCDRLQCVYRLTFNLPPSSPRIQSNQTTVRWRKDCNF